MTDRMQLIASHLANNSLHLIILPTEQCNLRCTYCYEDFARGRMDRKVVDGLKLLLDRRAPELERLWIAWFGGEPLLALDIVAEIQTHIQSLTRRHSRLHTSASMTTNGLLLDRRRLRRLLALGVTEYQITFDGPRKLHDQKRVRIGGEGTFDRIWGNLCAARELSDPFEIVVRMHVDRDNHDELAPFIHEYHEIFGADPRFHLFLRPLSRLGGPRDAELPTFEPEEGLRAAENLRRRARQLDLRCFEATEAASICYASRADSFAVRADGRLAKCAVALSDPDNSVGWLGSDGRVEVDAKKMTLWTRGLWSGDRAELACPLNGYAESRARMGPRPVVWWKPVSEETALPGGTVP
jgi:uncharacterized protein